MDAKAAVRKSVNWNNVGKMVISSSQSKDIPMDKQQIPDGNTTGLTSVLNVTDLNATLDFIEYIDIEIDIKGQDYGDLQINLISPAGKVSVLAEEHGCKNLFGFISGCIFNSSTKVSFGSARHLGESPGGDWTLEVIDQVSGNTNNVYSWGLKFYGHKKP